MICRSCLRAASRSSKPTLSSVRSSSRPLSNTPALRNATPISVNISTQTVPGRTPPPATSTSAAQPFSAPITPAGSPQLKKDAAAVAEKKATPLVRSSVPAGTPLKGLNFLKDKSDPVAMADDEYPEWLWTILDRQEKKGEGAGAGDLFSKSKKQRRLAAKRLRKEQLANPELLVPKVPVYEQTVDLPASDGSLEGAVKAIEARDGLTKAMRGKRRADIKEKNFLKAMG
ncbi:hypothetical protein CC80DRAFT_480409 [Byssothecium circinans]|uniref:Large ribosomal subunit protein mL54 n=1 Tax=Byssothecium circinans TaxID=147558 RepID=A0A6A5TGG9_9PLEO|nr:hypothetical protein CC80DRAFT_480409 [Byssothecium circinans]